MSKPKKSTLPGTFDGINARPLNLGTSPGGEIRLPSSSPLDAAKRALGGQGAEVRGVTQGRKDGAPKAVSRPRRTGKRG